MPKHVWDELQNRCQPVDSASKCASDHVGVSLHTSTVPLASTAPAGCQSSSSYHAGTQTSFPESSDINTHYDKILIAKKREWELKQKSSKSRERKRFEMAHQELPPVESLLVSSFVVDAMTLLLEDLAKNMATA